MIIVVGKSDLGRFFLTGTCDFGKIEWASVSISGERNPVFPTALRTFKAQFRPTNNARVHNIVDITGLSLGTVQWQDSVLTLIKMNTVNGWSDILSALHTEALISKTNERHEISETL